MTDPTLIVPGFNEDHLEVGGPFPFQDGPRFTLQVYNGRAQTNVHLCPENAQKVVDWLQDRLDEMDRQEIEDNLRISIEYMKGRQ